MLAALEGRATDRKLWLFAAAACRSIWDLMACEKSREAVLAVELFADGLVGEAEFLAARSRSREAAHHATDDLTLVRDEGTQRLRLAIYAANSAIHASHLSAIPFLKSVRESAAWASEAISLRHPYLAGQERHCDLLRDIFGPMPSSPPGSLPPALIAWNGGLVVNLAQAAYDDRLLPSGHLHPASLAVLADALEEAGAGGHEMLEHLRRPVEHVRGCWCLDLLLGKE